MLQERRMDHVAHAGHHHSHGKPAARDPVCGMTVDPESSKHRFEHHGESFHFCCAGCRTKFAADPQKYLDKREPPDSAPVPEGAIYTCPMHPEIRQTGPGSCPICGMALEPDVVSLDAAPNPELADMTRRFWIGAALSVPVVALDMLPHLGFSTNWPQLILATPAVLWAG